MVGRVDQVWQRVNGGQPRSYDQLRRQLRPRPDQQQSPEVKPEIQQPVPEPVVRWLTVIEAAEYARRHPSGIRAALAAGDLIGEQGCFKGKWSVSTDALDEWITRR